MHRSYGFQHLRHKRPRLFSPVKVGTHSAFGEKSHTVARTPKQGAFLPRPQRGLVLPVNSFLFRHAFIYIHFPVHCEPPLSAERKIRRNCRHKFYPQPFLIPVFNFLHKRPTFAFTSESGYTLGSLKKSHTRAHTAKQVAFWVGVVSLPSARFACCRNAGRPLVKTTHLPFSWSGYFLVDFSGINYAPIRNLENLKTILIFSIA